MNASSQPSLLVSLSLERNTRLFSDDFWSRLKALFPDLRVIEPENLSTDQWQEAITAANPDILMTGWDIPRLPESPPPNLKYVCHLTGAMRKFIPRSYLEKGIRITNWGDSISHTIAEMGLFLILHGLRNANIHQENLHRLGHWKEEAPIDRSLFGRNVGIHGFGRIARKLVELLQPFRPRISAFSPPVPSDLFESCGVRQADSLHALFAENEIVVELEGFTPENRGMVQAQHLAALPDDGLLVVIGRAGLIEEAAFTREMLSGRIRGALDVFWQEPLPADSPLRGLRNLALFPHTAGPTPDQLHCCTDRALENLRRYLQGEALLEELDVSAYDRIT
jgi:phosphoglycerate dehydrogenase-like enzyme